MSAIGTRRVPRVALVALLTLITRTAMAQSIEGTAAYRARTSLPPTEVFEAVLEDVKSATRLTVAEDRLHETRRA